MAASLPKDQLAHWEAFAEKLKPLSVKELEAPLAELNLRLTLRSYLEGHRVSEVDLLIWQALRQNRVAHSYIKQGLMVNLTRWSHFIEHSTPSANLAIHPKEPSAENKNKATASTGDDYGMELPNVKGKVVTRFPPEPSGYLHIGHAKAALLNDYFAHKKYTGGTLILRFDDTNPLKEKQEFEDSIIQDLELLGVKPDKLTHTSDYFQELYEYCVKMIKDGKAYADDTDREVMKKQRYDGLASSRRDMTPEESLKRFEEMKTGSEEGTRWFIRAKISVDDTNKALRDPVIYRCSPQKHHRTGDTWKIYPTYDFCCPIVDALEGVTHALRTTEYNDRDAQYQWILKAANSEWSVYNWNFARLNFMYTLLSKRKLTMFVNNGTVWGWDDPRFPTVRGVRRRGMTIPALREFILSQGPSKNVVNQDWTSFWAINKKHIDPVAPRFTAVVEPEIVTVKIHGAGDKPHKEQKDKHAKNKEVGTKTVVYSENAIIDQEDARSFSGKEEITLMNWGNAILRDTPSAEKGQPISHQEFDLHLEGDFKKTKKKITWLSKDQDLVPVELYDFGYLITKEKLDEDDRLEDFLTPKTEFLTKGFGDCNVAELKEGDILQFDRKGYFRCDRAYANGKAATFFQIPTGKTK